MTGSGQRFARLGRRVAWAVGVGPRVLCADDDANVRKLCVAALERARFRVDSAEDGRQALDAIAERRYSAIILDLGMPLLHGATVLALLQRERPEVMRRLIVMTGAPDAAVTAIPPTVRQVLRKPVTVDALLDAVRACCVADMTA